jgi:hypothetical protein
MNQVKVKKEELLAKLRANLDKHVNDYTEACKGYRLEAAIQLAQKADKIAELTKKLRDGETLPIEPIYFEDLDMPQSHEGDYRQIIEMAEMSTDDIIILSHSEFKQYIRDDWSWKQNFTISNAKYLGK